MFETRTLAGLETLIVPGDPDGATILILHGFGADANDISSIAGVYRGSPRPTWVFPNGPVEIPIVPGFNGRAWFDLDIEALQGAIRSNNFDEIEKVFPEKTDAIRENLEDLIAELGVPRSKLLLGGFSQGAVLATDLALNHPHSSAALLIFSGTLVHKSQWEKQSHLHGHTHFFQSHGTEDPLLPLTKAEELEKLLQQGGLQGKLHTFEGGHEIPQSILSKLHQFLSERI